MRKRTLKTASIVSAVIFLVLSGLLIGCSGHQKQQSPATQQRFKDIDKWVKIFEDPKRDEWQKPAEVVKTMDLQPGDVIVDIGAGTGYFTRRFAVAVSPGGRALGLDIEQSMVDYMNEDARKLNLGNYEAKVIQTDDPGLEPRSVDVIFLSNTYHHLENRVEYFKNVSHSLKPDGRIIIVDFYKDIDFGPPRDHKLARGVVMKEMKQAGYRLNKDLKILQHQYYLEYVVQ